MASNLAFQASQQEKIPEQKTRGIIKLVSRIEEDSVSYTWKIKDFDKIPFVSKYPIYGPAFNLGKHNDSQWQIVMTKHEFWNTERGVYDEEGEDDPDYIPEKGASDEEGDEIDDSENNTQCDDSRSETVTLSEAAKHETKKEAAKSPSKIPTKLAFKEGRKKPSMISPAKPASKSGGIKSSPMKSPAIPVPKPGGVKSPMKSPAEPAVKFADVTSGAGAAAEIMVRKRTPSAAAEGERKRLKRLGFRLDQVDETSTWKVVKYTFTLLNSEGDRMTTEEVVTTAGLVPPKYSYLTTENLSQNRTLFEETYLEVVCNVTYSYVHGGQFESPVECNEIVGDLQILFHSKKFSDVVLVVNGGEFYAHKNVLCARAPEFQRFFKGDDDKPKHKFDLQLDAAVADALIRFIYGGKIPANFDPIKCLDLHEAALTYGVNGLDKQCSKFFKLNLDNEVCRDCLGIEAQLDDCLDTVKKLGITRVREILNRNPCSHQPKE